MKAVETLMPFTIDVCSGEVTESGDRGFRACVFSCLAHRPSTTDSHASRQGFRSRSACMGGMRVHLATSA